MSRALALEWSHGSVRLRALPHDQVLATLALEARGEQRNDVAALFPGPVLRVPSGRREPFLRVSGGGLSGGRLEPAPRVPGDGSLSPRACRAHPGGALTAIDGSVVWVLGASQSVWVAHPLPGGVTAHDVSFAPDGSLWIAGSARAGAREIAALLRMGENGAEVVSPPLSDKDRRLLAKRRADDDYWRVDMEGTPGVVTASSARLHEDLTDFALVSWDAGWTVFGRNDRTISTWTRDGGLTLYLALAMRVRLAGHGATPQLDDLRPAIRAAWPGGAPSGDPSIRAAYARGDELLLAVSIYDWARRDTRLPLQGSAVLHSIDDGASFEPWAHTVGGDVELVDIIWL